MSRLRRLLNLKPYRHLRGSRAIRFFDFELRTPAFLKRRVEENEVKTFKIARLRYDLDNYKMEPESSIIEHVGIVNDMIKRLHNCGGILTEEEKYNALYATLPQNFQNILESYWIVENSHLESEVNEDEDFLNGKTGKYSTLVYLFLEDYIWKNFKKSSAVSRNTRLKTSKFTVIGHPWHKNMVTNNLEYYNIEYTIPKRLTFVYF